MIEGGEDLRDGAIGSEPIDEFGRHFDPFSGDFYIGHLPAEFEGMNIRNPQPGYRYYYAVNPERDRGSNLQNLMNRYDARLITNDDPESVGLGHTFQANTGSVRAFGDVVAVRIPQAKYDAVRLKAYEEHRGDLDGVVADYKSNDPLQNGKPTRYSGDTHGTHVEDF